MVEHIIRGSEYEDFLKCRKKWYHSWVEQIEPKRPDNKLFFGTLFHKWLEFYYLNDCHYPTAMFKTDTWFDEQDTSGMEQTELDEMITLFKGVAENYHKQYRDSDKRWNILATELQFKIQLSTEIWYTGTIDLVYEVDDEVRFADHKTVSSISSYVDRSKMDRQISRYWWTLNQLSKNKGFVKNPEGEWVKPYSYLYLDTTIDGFDYNLILKDYPKEPEVLKKGGLSKAKNQKTTYDIYLSKLNSLGLDMCDYTEILDILQAKGNPFLHREDVKRSQSELDNAIREFFNTAREMILVRNQIEVPLEDPENITYRTIGEHCQYMCGFKALCETAIQGGNVALTKSLAYTTKQVEEE